MVASEGAVANDVVSCERGKIEDGAGDNVSETEGLQKILKMSGMAATRFWRN